MSDGHDPYFPECVGCPYALTPDGRWCDCIVPMPSFFGYPACWTGYEITVYNMRKVML